MHEGSAEGPVPGTRARALWSLGASAGHGVGQCRHVWSGSCSIPAVGEYYLVPLEVLTLGRGKDLPPSSSVESSLVLGKEARDPAESNPHRAQQARDFWEAR